MLIKELAFARRDNDLAPKFRISSKT